MARRLDLDVDDPDKVVAVLTQAADAFYESAAELDATWQDKGAGRPWRIIAKELEAAANRIEHHLVRR